MPRRRPLHKYPDEYYELFERSQREPFELEFDSHERARYLRDELYALRASVRDTLAVDPETPELAEQYLLMENVVIELDDRKLKFRVRSYANLEALRKADPLSDTMKEK